jgi:hypothetical protein
MPIPAPRFAMMVASFLTAGAISLATWLIGMQSGVDALDAMSN